MSQLGWSAIVAEYELTEHELQILREAVRTVDLLDTLHKVAGEEGPLADSSQGRRVHPAIVELRQQRITLARLLATLNIPTEDTTVRAPRGVYGIRGTA
ncbi:hypothetical protein OED52_04255 [Rhodococcus sp. Z13]|uniref:Uncharacterized protein n=1 Tax=Rhodococcus sacchari TaxID=2962047 RepID=A0ACD4DIE0_9NOCA|nr:hypothetical protein [Rhodococcus sp. Z13]UYP19777.1 hypothetical protein OED52_04255 [Rhodococcus sp. Z13]